MAARRIQRRRLFAREPLLITSIVRLSYFAPASCVAIVAVTATPRLDTSNRKSERSVGRGAFCITLLRMTQAGAMVCPASKTAATLVLDPVDGDEHTGQPLT